MTVDTLADWLIGQGEEVHVRSITETDLRQYLVVPQRKCGIVVYDTDTYSDTITLIFSAVLDSLGEKEYVVAATNLVFLQMLVDWYGVGDDPSMPHIYQFVANDTNQTDVLNSLLDVIRTRKSS